MLFKVLRDKEVVFYTYQRSCIPCAELQKQLRKDGYKIVLLEDENASRSSKKADKKSKS